MRSRERTTVSGEGGDSPNPRHEEIGRHHRLGDGGIQPRIQSLGMLRVLREFLFLAVDDFVAVRASISNKIPQRSNKGA